MSTSVALDENVWILAATGQNERLAKDPAALEIIAASLESDVHLAATFPLFVQWKRQFAALGPQRHLNFPLVMSIFKQLAYTTRIEWIPRCVLSDTHRVYIEGKFGRGDLEVTRSAAGSVQLDKILATSDAPLRSGIIASGIDASHQFSALSLPDTRVYLLP